jgi:DNA-binding NtrC family response regulator
MGLYYVQNLNNQLSPYRVTSIEKPKILLVDDEPMMLSSMVRVLEDAYTVYTATSGEAALHLADTIDFAMIISDQRMPGMAGHQLLGRIRDLRPATVRILLTGYSDLDAIHHSVNTGQIFRYLSKPCTTEKLMEATAAAMDMRQRTLRIREQYQPKSTPALTPTSPAASSPVTTLSKPKPSVLDKANVMILGNLKFNASQLSMRLGNKYKVFNYTSPEETRVGLTLETFSVAICPAKAGRDEDLRLIMEIKHRQPQIKVIMVADALDAALMVRAINEVHIFKFMVRPITLPSLFTSIDEAMMRAKLDAA